MTTTVAHDMERSSADIGVVGNRHLTAIQTLDISRLTTHPVPLVPGTFIAVSGQGPKGDSNGSGKTSFLAAISLLLGDAQWRLEANGSQDAAKLLFSLPSAGLSADCGYASADHGYVIGVFAEKEDPIGTALTVWVRISSTPQYLRVRWTHGLHVVDSGSNGDPYIEADTLWQALPRDHEIGPKNMRTKLYGSAPKGIAYVDTSMRKSAPSLLSQQMTEMSPQQIADALIELTGRQGLLETEEEQRGLLATHQQDLAAQQQQDRENRAREEIELDAVRKRDQSRERLTEGERLWRLHFARGYLDVLAEDENLRIAVEELAGDVTQSRHVAADARRTLAQLLARTDLAEAERAAQQAHADALQLLRDSENRRYAKADQERRLNEEKAERRRAAEQWSGASLADAQVKVTEAIALHTEAQFRLREATEQHMTAQQALADAEAGGGGEAAPLLDRLWAVGIDARLLIDEITLAAEARTAWEPRLWPHRHAVVVAPDETERALAAVAGLPGGVLVIADGPLNQTVTGLPHGITAGVPVAGFLTALAERTNIAAEPDRAVDATLGEHTLGGFTAEVAGRAARVDAARARVLETDQAVQAALRAEQNAKAEQEIAREDLAAAQAAARIVEIDVQLPTLQAEMVVLDGKVAESSIAEEQARETSVQASANAKSHHEQVNLAQQKVLNAEQEVKRLEQMHRAKTQERAALRVSYWQCGWADSPEAARAFLEEQPEPVRSMRQVSLRNRSAEALKEALDTYTTTLTEVPTILDEAIRRRQALADGEARVGRDTVSFDSVAQPLRDLLDARSESDQILEARIQSEQHARASRIAQITEEVQKKQSEWENIQDIISARIEAALNKISTSLDRLNRASGGFGAELKIKPNRPTTPTSTWKWEVSPRWRRSASGGMVDYKEVANGAQVKVFAIQLVLAALLADEGARGRVLIIDELGNSLGDNHRKEVLEDLNDVARQQDVTILGTCQDSVIADAAGVCGEILWFSHANAADAYNKPTRMWGYDADGERVRLTQDWLTTGRTLV
jgi:hypothetical protein